MIQLKSQSNKTLNLILSNTNKALREVLKDIAPKDLTTLKQAKDLGSVLESLLKNNPQNETQNRELISLLKNNPTLKNLGNVTNTLKDLQETLQTPEVKKSLAPTMEKVQKVLTQTLNDITNITDKAVKNKIENSGVFFESKLKNFTEPKNDLKSLTQDLVSLLQSSKLPATNKVALELNTLLKSELFNTQVQNPKTVTELTQNIDKLLDKITQQMSSHFDKTQHPKDILFSKELKEVHTKLTHLNKPKNLMSETKLKELISDDFKHILKEATQELQNTNTPHKERLLQHLDKLNLQIDYYQLLSHLSNASCLYLPYSFDALEDGNITIKSAKNGKFFCDIELMLKEYGKLNLRLGMFEKNQLNINIECESKELQQLLQENLQELRENLSHAGIQPQSIRFINREETTHYTDEQTIDLGFEVKA